MAFNSNERVPPEYEGDTTMPARARSALLGHRIYVTTAALKAAPNETSAPVRK